MQDRRRTREVLDTVLEGSADAPPGLGMEFEPAGPGGTYVLSDKAIESWPSADEEPKKLSAGKIDDGNRKKNKKIGTSTNDKKPRK